MLQRPLREPLVEWAQLALDPSADSRFCGLSALDRTPWCWRPGRNETPAQAATQALARVSPGEGFTCGVDDAGAAWCWGDGRFGQLGNGDTLSSAVPVPVAGNLRFRDVSAGNLVACGVTGNEVYCWGLVSEVTNPFSGNVQSPVPVTVGLPGLLVSVGYAGGLATQTSQAYQWGGPFDASFERPQLLQSLPGLDRLILAAISADDSMCGMAADGTAWCSRDVFVGNPFDAGPAWIPVPAPDAQVALSSAGVPAAKASW